MVTREPRTPIADEGCQHIVVVGASAGGVHALLRFVEPLPVALRAAVFVVLHLPSGASSNLALVLARATALPVTTATDGVEYQPGHIYTAPPGVDLTLEGGHLGLEPSLPNSRFHPAIDRLFRTAARVAGDRAIGIILSGSLRDGAEGAKAVAEAGGLIGVQDPAEALHPGMPRAAVEATDPDLVAPAADLARWVVEMVGSLV